MKIIRLRKAKTITQAELGQRCGTSQQQIAKIEGGIVDPRLSTLRRIAQALDCDLQELFFTPAEFLQALRSIIKEHKINLTRLSVWELNDLCEQVGDIPRFDPLWEQVQIKNNQVELKE